MTFFNRKYLGLFQSGRATIPRRGAQLVGEEWRSGTGDWGKGSEFSLKQGVGLNSLPGNPVSPVPSPFFKLQIISKEHKAMSRSVAHQLSSIIPFSVISQIAKEIRIVPLIVLLGTAIPVWLVCEAIAPQSVQAYTARVDLAIDSLPEENYETIIRRAEAAARAAAQRSFDQDILVTDVSVVVTAQNYGAIAPVLSLEVSRPQWRNRPDPHVWATYFKTARSLLFFGRDSTTTNSPPIVPTTPTPAPQPAPTPDLNKTPQPIPLIPPPLGNPEPKR